MKYYGVLGLFLEYLQTEHRDNGALEFNAADELVADLAFINSYLIKEALIAKSLLDMTYQEFNGKLNNIFTYKGFIALDTKHKGIYSDALNEYKDFLFFLKHSLNIAYNTNVAHISFYNYLEAHNCFTTLGIDSYQAAEYINLLGCKAVDDGVIHQLIIDFRNDEYNRSHSKLIKTYSINGDDLVILNEVKNYLDEIHGDELELLCFADYVIDPNMNHGFDGLDPRHASMLVNNLEMLISKYNGKLFKYDWLDLSLDNQLVIDDIIAFTNNQRLISKISARDKYLLDELIEQLIDYRFIYKLFKLIVVKLRGSQSYYPDHYFDDVI